MAQRAREDRSYILNLFTTQCVDCENNAPHFEGRIAFDDLHDAESYREDWLQHNALQEWSRGISPEDSCAMVNICVLSKQRNQVVEVLRGNANRILAIAG